MSFKKDGYLQIVVGCMCAGKTLHMITEGNKLKSIGKKVLMINYALDTRYTNENLVVTHDKFSADCLMLKTLTGLDVENYDAILINEAQFFPDLYENVLLWCDKKKKYVGVYGLDGNYRREEFGDILKLCHDCDDYVKLKAYCVDCNDGTPALFTWKLQNRNGDSSVIDIGGTEKYVPLCREHWNARTLERV